MSQTQFFCLLSAIYLAPHFSHGWALLIAAYFLCIAVCVFLGERK